MIAGAVNQDIVFYQLNGFLLSFFPQPDLEKDAGIANREIKSKGLTPACIVETEPEVDELFTALKEKAVKIVTRPEKTFFGQLRRTFAPMWKTITPADRL